MKPTLLILAAGAGSRYGGLKQLDALGPNGETILHYSIYDAINSGFGKIVFVIRQEFKNEFEKRFLHRRNQVEINYVFQEVNPKFTGIEKVAMREKPWGTVHAALCARNQIREPFAVINADDFYGRGSFTMIAKFLQNDCSEEHWSMVGYPLKNTLSEHGGVSRGICELDEKHQMLKKITECRGIEKTDEGIFHLEDNRRHKLNADDIVSMNIWGFHPHFFELAETSFNSFVTKNARNPTTELTLPDLIQPLIEDNNIHVSLLKTSEILFGITYRQDKEKVAALLRELIVIGVYPADLSG